MCHRKSSGKSTLNVKWKSNKKSVSSIEIFLVVLFKMMNQIQRAFLGFASIVVGFFLVYASYSIFVSDDFGLRKEDSLSDTFINCLHAAAFVSAGSPLASEPTSSLARSVLMIHVLLASFAKIWIICGAPS